MLVVRFQRKGKKHQPSYRVVVAERRSKLGAPPVEDLGSYNVFTKALNVNAERVRYWVGAGAKPSATVWNVLVREKMVAGPKVQIKMRAGKRAAEGVVAETPKEPAAAPAP